MNNIFSIPDPHIVYMVNYISPQLHIDFFCAKYKTEQVNFGVA